MFEYMRSVFKKELDFNQETSDQETPLHLACKKGNLEMIQKIVDAGGDLSCKDQDGHTPLHDLLQCCYLEGGDTEACEKFRNVWGMIVKVCTNWWCCLWKIKLPDKHTSNYKVLRRDALHFLRSCIDNNNG